MNADDLGGFANGPNLTDDVFQSFQIPPAGGDVSGGLASYPGEGGYVYVNKNGGPMMAYRYSQDGSFELSGVSDGNSTTASTPSVTSLNGTLSPCLALPCILPPCCPPRTRCFLNNF